MKIGFIGLGIMGRPMAGHLVEGGHELFVHTCSRLPSELTSQGAHRLRARPGRWPGQADVIITMVPDTPHVEAVLFGAGGVAEGLSPGKIVVDMSSISPIETKEFAARINELGCDYLDAPVSGGEVGAKAAIAHHHGRRPEAAFEKGQAAVRADGQEHHAGRRQRRRPDHQGRQPDHRGADHRGGRRGAAVRVQGRRRSGQGAPGADGRLRQLAHPRGAWRAHDQAHLRSGLPHRAAPEGPEPGPGRRAGARRQPAQHRHRQELFNACAANGGKALGPLGHGQGAGADGEPSRWPSG